VHSALTAYVREQCGAVLAADALLRLRATPYAVHEVRLGVRGLRSVLRTLGPLLCVDPAEALRIEGELRWLALLFTDVRDADVLAQDIADRIDALPPELVVGPVRQEVAETLGGIRHRATAYAAEQCATARYGCLLATLANWHEQPPVGSQGAGVAERLLKDARRDARKRLGRLADDESLLHPSRKAVKRLRHAAEALTSVVPNADGMARRAKSVAGTLGSRRDLGLEAAFLREMAVRHGSRYGHNGFVYGVLLGQVEAEISALRPRQDSNL
jgi:CHAD domain-containing protein